MFQKIISSRLFSINLLVCALLFSVFSTVLQAQTYPQQYPQQPYYNQQGDPNQNDENFTAKSPYKLEIAKLEANVYRPGEEPIPLSQIPRLNQGDVLKVKISNEAVNGVMPHQSNWDWTLLVAFINPSRNNASEETVSREVRLKDVGWYNDNFFTVPYDSQPMIFLYPKPKYRKQILDLISKRPDDIREMGEKVIEISSAYGHISSFLSQVQYMMSQPEGYGNGLLEQSIEGMARTFGVQLPSCWSSYGGYSGGYGGYGSGYTSSYPGYNNLASRAQCISRNIRMEDLNYSVGRMISQGGLMALAQLRQSHPEISKWIAIAAVAIDFIMKLTRKSAIRIIPALVSTPDNPIFTQQGYYQGGFYGGGGNGYYNGGGNNYNNGGNAYYQGGTPGNGFTQNNPADVNKISLLANYQPTDKQFVTVYAYVPHKWQPEVDPKIANLYAPQMTEPCFHAGKNILRNMDLRVEWLSDTFTRDFKLVLNDKNGWKKDFVLRKNLGLNAWEAEISKEDIAALPKNNVFDAKITGKRGFTTIESPTFQIPIANGGAFEATIRPNSNGKSIVNLRRTGGDARCSQNIVYKSSTGQPIIFPITKENSFLRMTPDGSEVAFEVEAAANPMGESVQVQLFGGETIPAIIKP